MTTEARDNAALIEQAREIKEAEHAASREKMRPALIPDEEELRLEGFFFDTLGLDDMSHADVTLKDGTRIQYFPSEDRKNRQMSVRGKEVEISIGRWRDLSKSSPWVLEGAYAHFTPVIAGSKLGNNGEFEQDIAGIEAMPLIEAEFKRLFSVPKPQTEP